MTEYIHTDKKLDCLADYYALVKSACIQHKIPCEYSLSNIDNQIMLNLKCFTNPQEEKKWLGYFVRLWVSVRGDQYIFDLRITNYTIDARNIEQDDQENICKTLNQAMNLATGEITFNKFLCLFNNGRLTDVTNNPYLEMLINFILKYDNILPYKVIQQTITRFNLHYVIHEDVDGKSIIIGTNEDRNDFTTCMVYWCKLGNIMQNAEYIEPVRADDVKMLVIYRDLFDTFSIEELKKFTDEEFQTLIGIVSI